MVIYWNLVGSTHRFPLKTIPPVFLQNAIHIALSNIALYLKLF